MVHTNSDRSQLCTILTRGKYFTGCMWEYGVFSQMAQGILKFLLMNMLRRFNPHQIGGRMEHFSREDDLEIRSIGHVKKGRSRSVWS